MKAKIISIDFQNDFIAKGGHHYKPRPSVDFVKNILIPYLKNEGLKIAEIISDYRPPRFSDRSLSCHPGEWGYESGIPASVKEETAWIKCMNSPIWTRDNVGDPRQKPGIPYQDPKKFDEWILKTIGKPEDTEIILVGLTLDCCVLCVAPEFCFRGFNVKILKEAVDVYSGKQEEKEMLFKLVVANCWAKTISWNQAKKMLASK
ncbi:MAG: isochorismatase family protein [Patescibacteria group bacterium]|nr:isochorismatase family protein [Patescibacteria group bacterium]